VLKHPRNYLQFFLVSQLCLFVQQNIFRLRLLNIGVCLNYLQCQFMLDSACTKTHHFEIKNAKNFMGRGYPRYEGHPLPRPHSVRRLDLRAYGAQAQRDTSRKKS